jgi:hypothetical protein
MPKITIKPGEWLDNTAKPLVQEVGNAFPLVAGTVDHAYDAFRTTVVGAAGGESREFNVDVHLPQLPGPPVPDGTPGVPSTPALPPVDPKRVLEELAKAIRDAERILTSEHMMTMSADIDVTLVVDIGGVAGGQANLKLHIGPVPQG